MNDFGEKKYALLLKSNKNSNLRYAMKYVAGRKKITNIIRERPLYSDEIAEMIEEFGFEVVLEVANDMYPKGEKDEDC